MEFTWENVRKIDNLVQLPVVKHSETLNPLPHAPKRNVPLNVQEKKLAIKNALRYFSKKFHTELASEFYQELKIYGHVYMFRFCPLDLQNSLKAPSINDIPARSSEAAAIILMILNNLDSEVAQYPQELVTYGGNGQVFSNWWQFWLVMNYLLKMTDTQTLVLYSGHPLGLFPSHKNAPRMVITNGMMVPNYSSKELYDKYFALNVTLYGQMTAGSFCYIGPQGIVHGTTITILNAARKYLNTTTELDLRGKVFVSSGLGGMSGAQAKATVICGCIGVIAEICPTALEKRYKQGWLMEKTDSLDHCIIRIRGAKKTKEPLSLGYLGNVVDLWERLALEYKNTGQLLVDFGSDQTSCHNPFNGGYYPVQLSFEDSNKMMRDNPESFKMLVQESLLRQISAIDTLSEAGAAFWDYGNAFLLECWRAGAKVALEGDVAGTRFRYPSYVQDIMGDIFSMGFGPFRWVCASGDPMDLKTTDNLASETLENIMKNNKNSSMAEVYQQYEDNLKWIREAAGHKLVVGSQARVLYSDQQGRIAIALAFNDAVKSGKLKGPIIISRDHHDVSGTDSPFRETSNITDGSAFTADMAVQNFVGDAFRGATWVALHNGGGVGWGEAINGGFGLLLDGSDEARERAISMLKWDVGNGVARRSWSGNPLAKQAVERAMTVDDQLVITLPNDADDKMLDEVVG